MEKPGLQLHLGPLGQLSSAMLTVAGGLSPVPPEVGTDRQSLSDLSCCWLVNALADDARKFNSSRSSQPPRDTLLTPIRADLVLLSAASQGPEEC